MSSDIVGHTQTYVQQTVIHDPHAFASLGKTLREFEPSIHYNTDDIRTR